MDDPITLHREYPSPLDEKTYSEYVLGRTLTGCLAVAMTPLAWRGSQLSHSVALDGYFDQPLGIHFPVDAYVAPWWLSGLLSFLLSSFIIWRAQRHARGWWTTLLWGAFVLVMGIPAATAYALMGPRERSEACPRCGRHQSARFPACPSCGLTRLKPIPLGIEILRPLSVDEPRKAI